MDVLTGRELYLKHTVAAGPQAQQLAADKLAEFVRQVEQGRHPKTNASLQQLVERHLEVSGVEPRTKATLTGYLRKHVAPFIGDRPIGAVNAEVLDSLYAELARCRQHCDGRPTIEHHTTAEHACDRRWRLDHSQSPLSDQRRVRDRHPLGTGSA